MTIEQPNTRARYRKRKSPSGTAEVWLERAGSRVTTHTRTVGPNSGSSSGGNWDKCDVDACLGEAVIQQSK
jgi:hypothetical protein